MPASFSNLSDDPAELRALVLASRAALAAREEELNETRAALAQRDREIEASKLTLLKLRRMQFGRSSEKLALVIGPLELKLERSNRHRKQVVLRAFFLVLIVVGVEAPASEGSPYAGQETREIAALSDSDVAGLLAGKGMGHAKAAELNGYPGPRHVLDLAEELDLTAKQRVETQEIFNQMHASAKELGAELVAAERELDDLFRKQVIEQRSLSEIMAKIGRIEGRLREVHLHAHLRQTQLLSTQQVSNYMMLRGYERGRHEHRHRHSHDGRSNGRSALEQASN